MRITIICSSSEHPVNAWLQRWIAANGDVHEISLLRRIEEIAGGDILFLISCTQIVTAEHRALFDCTLVIHASDLPLGRGWSPHVWAIAQGAEQIAVTLLEAEDKVDSGAIWGQLRLDIPRHFLSGEINAALFDAELQLMDLAISLHGTNPGVPQRTDIEPSYLPKRTRDDSRVDPSLSIAEQFDLIRVCDPERFPAFFEIHGHRYKIILEKI
ncbi:MAG: formyltransferase family protein [Devosia marina]|uniref:formyltransferase family protein n=1 Tax=Devosia marina TaxID=2683198 RepID=UPI0032EF4E98